ncbi:hypothetical protein [Nocardioides sp. MH1]|uniref:hypothetical protein n=1 Tax=Nocardioides sp. MH1 TaxID=3242490 RepID=UPI00352198DE
MPEPDLAPADPTGVTVAVLVGFGLPMTAVAASFAFGSLEDVAKGVGVAIAVWICGVAVALVHPLDTSPTGQEDVRLWWRWGVPGVAIAAMIVVVYTGKPFVPWMLVLVVGTFFAWITGSLWVLARRRAAPPEA